MDAFPRPFRRRDIHDSAVTGQNGAIRGAQADSLTGVREPVRSDARIDMHQRCAGKRSGVNRAGGIESSGNDQRVRSGGERSGGKRVRTLRVFDGHAPEIDRGRPEVPDLHILLRRLGAGGVGVNLQ